MCIWAVHVVGGWGLGHGLGGWGGVKSVFVVDYLY